MEIKEGEYTIFKNGKIFGVITHTEKGPAVVFVNESHVDGLAQEELNQILQKFKEINLAAYSRG